MRIVGVSANRGIVDDVALGRTSVLGERWFAVVVGENGEFNAAPYRPQVETSAPLDLDALLGSAACSGAPLVGSGQATSGVVTLFDGAGTTTYITQREHMRAVHGMDGAAWNAMSPS